MGPLAYIAVQFDPFVRLGDFALRWQTIGIAFALLVGIMLAVRGRARASLPAPQAARRRAAPLPRAPSVRPRGELIEAQPLRLDDMAFILLASAPGAVLGGRLVHGLVYWPAYAANPERLWDPAYGSLSLLGAVLGGVLSGTLMAVLLAAPVRRWADVAAEPLLVTLGLGKLAQFLGGSGQGAPSSSSWAVAFVGDGPWISPQPALPAHAAQLYEGFWLLLGALLVLSLAGPIRERPSRTGALLPAALAIFLIGRVVVGFSWRDQPVIAALNAEQLAALAVLGLAAAGSLVAAAVRAGRARYRESLRGMGGGA